jgi:transcriptional regulator with XRE-family HTH domain
MTSAQLIRDARLRAGLSLRGLAARAGTSHSTLAAYEHGRKDPSVGTLERILRATGVAVDVTLAPRERGGDHGEMDRGDELLEALRLAEMFPARHDERLAMPPFGLVDSAA